MDFVEEIKSRLSIEELVSQYVQLKKAGRSYKGLCPFHSEKTPSFVVSPEKGIAYCFGCHKGGDIFKFVQEVESVDFPGAVRMLADKTGVKLEDNFSKKMVAEKSQNEPLFEANVKICKFFVEQLWAEGPGAKVLAYLHKRGLTDSTIKAFQLGFAPDSFELSTNAMLHEGFDNKVLMDAGLVSAKDTASNHVYDRFRARLMFPISDSVGRVVAFGGRALKVGDEPKYLNTSDTRIYHKSGVLYGFFQNKAHIKKAKSTLVVEGYMDMLMSFQDGVKNVVAVSGTALTERHIKMLKAVCTKLIFAFDSDNAGLEAAKRAFTLADKQGLQVYVIDLNGYKDPADYTLDNPGKLADRIKEAKPFMEVLMHRLSVNTDLFSIEGKKSFLQQILPFLNGLNSSVEKEHYIRLCADILQVNSQVMHEELQNHGKASHEFVEKDVNSSRINDSSLSADEHLLALILAFPQLLGQFADFLADLEFSGLLQAIYKEFLAQYNTARLGEDWVFDYQNLEDEERQKAMFLMLFGEEENAYLGEHGLREQMQRLIERHKLERFNRQRKIIENNIREAQRDGNKELMQGLMAEMRDLLAR